MRMHNPAHPGIILREYLNGASITDVAKRLGISRVALSRIVNAQASITPEMAVRLSQLLNNTSPNFWLNMQANYDLWQIKQHKTFNITPLFPEASLSSMKATVTWA
ncbi:plasmid maintenance system antidote protein [Haemophilus influenzae F3031]|nr:plasmid maintenance system antidote protein [Haemophilus influenzae F3031]